VKNIHLLSMIITYKPRSVYELAKLSNIDVSNLNKIILFFEEFGVLKLKEMKVNGRNVKKPIVEYNYHVMMETDWYGDFAREFQSLLLDHTN
jgi:predicted transcriptional regulator